MLIIVEGPDGAGKTWLCNQLERAIRQDPVTCYDTVTRLTAGPPTKHPLDEYERPLLYYRPVSDRHVICDRWHVGEFVYPPVLKRESAFTPAVYRHISMFLQARGAVTILLLPPLEKLKHTLTERGDDLVDADMLEELMWRYQELPNELQPQVILNDWDVDVHRLVRIAHEAEYHAAHLRPYVTYVGPTQPLLLLLGDVRGKPQVGVEAQIREYANRRTPAFMPHAATSGNYLLSHMADPEMGLANACDVDNPAELWSDLLCPKVVALGQNAHRRLDDLKVPHGVVPHPQFVRRFHHLMGAHYASLIHEAATTGKDLSTWR